MNSPLTHFSSPAQSQTQRVPGDIFLKFSSTMKPLCCFIISLLYILPALSVKMCSDKQYPWPFLDPHLCCDKCPPGYFVEQRSRASCDHTCKPCGDNKFTDNYNTAMSCQYCKSCNNPNMEIKAKCNATHNTVCKCKAGYKCKSHDCKECVVIPTTTKPTVPPSTTTVARPGAVTTQLPPKPIGDTMWFLVIIALLCTGIVLVFVTKVKPFLLWIKSKHGYFLAENPALQPPRAGLEVVSKPVQEMCGKCEIRV